MSETTVGTCRRFVDLLIKRKKPLETTEERKEFYQDFLEKEPEDSSKAMTLFMRNNIMRSACPKWASKDEEFQSKLMNARLIYNGQFVEEKAEVQETTQSTRIKAMSAPSTPKVVETLKSTPTPKSETTPRSKRNVSFSNPIAKDLAESSDKQANEPPAVEKMEQETILEESGEKPKKTAKKPANKKAKKSDKKKVDKPTPETEIEEEMEIEEKPDQEQVEEGNAVVNDVRENFQLVVDDEAHREVTHLLKEIHQQNKLVLEKLQNIETTLNAKTNAGRPSLQNCARVIGAILGQMDNCENIEPATLKQEVAITDPIEPSKPKRARK